MLLLLRLALWTNPSSIWVIEATALPPVITACVFVMSTVFANVISDYKESEKIPAELVAYFQAMINFSIQPLAELPHADHRPMLAEVQTMLLSVLSTLDQTGEFEDSIKVYNRSATRLAYLLKKNGVHELESLEHAVTEIQKKWTRIHDIGRLSIILAGYTLMDFLCVLLMGVLCAVKYTATDTGFWVILVFGSACMYLNLLVRTLDDPFDGPKLYHWRCYTHEQVVNKTLYEGFKFSTMVRSAVFLLFLPLAPPAIPEASLRAARACVRALENRIAGAGFLHPRLPTPHPTTNRWTLRALQFTWAST